MLLLHGAYSSLEEWSLVSKHLRGYHLLIPDLPSHGTASSAPLPFLLASTADLLAKLIGGHAHGGRASIVGLSLGGYLASYLASRYPEVVDSVFVSGCHISWAGSWKSLVMGRLLAMSAVWTFGTLPKSWMMYWARSKGLQMTDARFEGVKARCQYWLGVRIGKAIEEECPPSVLMSVKARTALVVGRTEMRQRKLMTE